MFDATEYSIVQRVVEIVALLGGLGGLAAFGNMLIGRRGQQAAAKKTEAETEKVPADTASVLADASGDVVDQYRKLLTDYKADTESKFATLHTEIKGLRESSGRYLRRITYLMSGIQLLSDQIVGLDHKPCWAPDDWPEEKKAG